MPGTVSKYSFYEKQDLDGRKRKAGLTLEEITLPRIKNTKTQGNYASYDIEPLEAGYGMTLGNALRRVLLSSLPGAAVTSIRIDGAQHEFQDISHVMEDVTDIVLNVKKTAPTLLFGSSSIDAPGSEWRACSNSSGHYGPEYCRNCES